MTYEILFQKLDKFVFLTYKKENTETPHGFVDCN